MAASKRANKDILFVGVQLAFFIVYLFRIETIDISVSTLLKYAGVFLAFDGLLVIAIAIINLNRNLTAFPTPKATGKLIVTGIYKYIRHPIYSGIILFTLGYGLYSENTLRLIISLSLFSLFIMKARYEEMRLAEKFPEYANYKSGTKMFFPGLL